MQFAPYQILSGLFSGPFSSPPLPRPPLFCSSITAHHQRSNGYSQDACVIVCLSAGLLFLHQAQRRTGPNSRMCCGCPCAPRREHLWQNGCRTERGPVPLDSGATATTLYEYTALSCQHLPAKGQFSGHAPSHFLWQRAVMAKGQASAVDMYVHAATVVQTLASS